MKYWCALGVSVLLLGGIAAPAVVEARGGGGGGGGGGFRGGGGGGEGFRGGGDFSGGGGAYRFSSPPAEAAPRMGTAPIEREASGGGGSAADRPAERSLDQGYRGSHPLYGAGSRTPWTGHNVSADQFRRYNQSGWSNDGINRSFDNDRFNRQFN